MAECQWHSEPGTRPLGLRSQDRTLGLAPRGARAQRNARRHPHTPARCSPPPAAPLAPPAHAVSSPSRREGPGTPVHVGGGGAVFPSELPGLLELRIDASFTSSNQAPLLGSHSKGSLGGGGSQGGDHAPNLLNGAHFEGPGAEQASCLLQIQLWEVGSCLGTRGYPPGWASLERSGQWGGQSSGDGLSALPLPQEARSGPPIWFPCLHSCSQHTQCPGVWGSGWVLASGGLWAPGSSSIEW